jgi:hypothetical protein
VTSIALNFVFVSAQPDRERARMKPTREAVRVVTREGVWDLKIP